MGTISIMLMVVVIIVFIYFKFKKVKINTLTKVDYIPEDVTMTKIETELFDLINHYKTSIGLKNVKIDGLCRDLCYTHCKNMVDTEKVGTIVINHNNNEGRMSVLIMHGGKSIGEMVTYGYSTANGFINGYIKNDKYRKTLEKDNYTHVGIRMLKTKNGRYVNTVLFSEFKK